MTKILAIDPGVTTGYCIGELELGPELVLSPFQEIHDVDESWDLLEKVQPRYIIIEDFEFRQKARTGLVLFSVQLIGVARLYSLKSTHQIGLVVQKAAQGKSYYKDNTLKDYGIYKRGIPHGMDAMRHLLQWITFSSGYQLIEGRQIKEIVRLGN